MALFKPLLSPKAEYRWTQELEEVFHKAKENIVGKVREGVTMFVVSKVTVLNTD